MINFTSFEAENDELLRSMCQTMEHRGPDQNGIFSSKNVKFGHNRLAIIDIENGIQPMTRIYKGKKYTIVYNGEIYNTPQIKSEVEALGIKTESSCDTEYVLYSYILWGEKCAEKLNGIFAFTVYDEDKDCVFFARDRFGVKPLFYSMVGNSFVFASEIKSLLKHPKIRPIIDKKGLWQLLFLSPMKLCGTGVFRDISEIEPATYAFFDKKGLNKTKYWELKAEKFYGDRIDAIVDTRDILSDAILSQLVSDVPLCTLLSGGIDSSVISAVAAKEYGSQGEKLSTFSFEYNNNKENFKNSLFQPQADDEFAIFMADYLGTNHKVLSMDSQILVDHLFEATRARDLPGMADIDSSLLYYCREVKKSHTVSLSGECADEIFGGYPWFYRPEMLERNFYPWIHNPFARINLFRKNVVSENEGFDYLSKKYEKDTADFPRLESDSDTMLQSRKATYLSVKYFMTSLLERKDRMSMASGVEVRVPFSDHRLLEYIYNVPWEIKYEGEVEKSLLRNAMSDYLPDKILNRKKSPYPKTHDPNYEKMMYNLLENRLSNNNSIIHQIIDKNDFLEKIRSIDSTWYGQLMSLPQLMAWVVQLDYWLMEYGVELEL